ncbi:MAG TPA: DUF4282 domain-containing protein [Stellaceae bacterium]|jgi:hypothetical protein|nr:DUF4282 domain-containing protein [Stellaceae bacterium]
MGEFVRFELMITPVVIQILFWVAAAMSVVGGLLMILISGNGRGILLVVFGPLAARIYAELMVIFFRINDTLREILANTRRV